MRNNIKHYRELAGLSQFELGQEVGFSDKHISAIENGKRRLNIELAQKIAIRLNVKLSKLFEEDSNNATIPITGYVGAGGHIDVDFCDSSGQDEVSCPSQYNSDNTLAFKVDGESMLPEYKQGSVVFCRDLPPSNIEDCIKKDCIVLLQDGTQLLKNIQKDTDGNIILVSYNNAYAPIVNPKIKDIRKIGTIIIE